MGDRDQEAFWRGGFGDQYSERNVGESIVASNCFLFGKVLASMTEKPANVFEMGANVGLNYLALKTLVPNIRYTGLEVNPSAAEKLASLGCNSINESIHDFDSSDSYDLVLSKGVLIHINPNLLEGVYEKLFRFSRRYILLAEYYNPSPVEIDYRGHSGRLFKRDFAGEMLDAYPSLSLVSAGFSYHRDRFPQDDLTWFLLEKGTTA